MKSVEGNVYIFLNTKKRERDRMAIHSAKYMMRERKEGKEKNKRKYKHLHQQTP